MSITNAKVFNTSQTRKGYTFGNYEGLASVTGKEKAAHDSIKKVLYGIEHQVSYAAGEIGIIRLYPSSAVKS